MNKFITYLGFCMATIALSLAFRTPKPHVDYSDVKELWAALNKTTSELLGVRADLNRTLGFLESSIDKQNRQMDAAIVAADHILKLAQQCSILASRIDAIDERTRWIDSIPKSEPGSITPTVLFQSAPMPLRIP
jgi:hypothetical protein